MSVQIWPSEEMNDTVEETEDWLLTDEDEFSDEDLDFDLQDELSDE